MTDGRTGADRLQGCFEQAQLARRRSQLLRVRLRELRRVGRAWDVTGARGAPGSSTDGAGPRSAGGGELR